MRCGLEIGKVAGGEVFDRERRLDPKNVDRPMDAGAIGQRHSNRRCPVRERRSSIGNGHEAWVTGGVPPTTRLTQDLVEPVRIARQAVTGSVEFGQPSPSTTQDMHAPTPVTSPIRLAHQFSGASQGS
jgi:hypothetical protein